tara:strand:- start:57 stop:413 length:357 start_codon:yes stop_codon:yes gene_type:complete
MARKQGHNKVMFEEKIKNELNMTLRRNLSDPRLTFASFTRVELLDDYSMAKVYWDTFDSEKKDEIKQAFDGVASKLRSVLAKELNVRHTPALELYYDSQYEDERKIESLLEQNWDEKK